MALELNNTVTGKKSESESLDILAGSDDSMHLKAGETFVGVIIKVVIQTAGTVMEILANDASSTDIIGSGPIGYKNITGVSLPVGNVITAGKYKKGANIKSITMGTASATIYYKYPIVNV